MKTKRTLMIIIITILSLNLLSCTSQQQAPDDLDIMLNLTTQKLTQQIAQ